VKGGVALVVRRRRIDADVVAEQCSHSLDVSSGGG
jgi:hypothetical protein